MGATSYLLLAAQILSFGHFLLVRHVTCPKHGDVIHPSRPHEALSVRSMADEVLASGQAIAGQEPQTEVGHDHCLICVITHERFALPPPTGTRAESIQLTLLLVSPSDAGVFSPVAPIVLSPKNSPPAV